MAKEYLTFSGKCKWANKLITPDVKFNKWGVQLYFDQPSLEKFREYQAQYGFMNRLKKDDDGYYLNFNRPTSKTMGGRVVGFAPPKVTYNGEPFANAIGNGSDITVVVELYSYTDPYGKRNYAIRLESARIDNLITYTPDRDVLDEADKEAYKRADEAPKPLF